MEPNVDTQQLWTELHERLFSFIRRRVPADADAEDILQETFTRIHANAHRLSELDSVSGWVYRITRNAIVDHHRARAKDAGTLERLAGSAVATDGQEADAGDADTDASTELAHCIEPLVSRLPGRYSQAVSLTELQGMAQKDAAAEVGLSVSGMKSRVQRGRAKLKEMLLGCCEVELDQRRHVVDVQPKNGGTPGDCCAPGAPDCKS